jgi:hypothetical protein
MLRSIVIICLFSISSTISTCGAIIEDRIHFEFHEVNYPDHRAVDIPEQFNFHMTEFSGIHLSLLTGIIQILSANLQSVIRIDPDTPPGAEMNLWLQCESYEFSEEGFNRPIQRHAFDYRRVIIIVGGSGSSRPAL